MNNERTNVHGRVRFEWWHQRGSDADNEVIDAGEEYGFFGRLAVGVYDHRSDDGYGVIETVYDDPRPDRTGDQRRVADEQPGGEREQYLYRR